MKTDKYFQSMILIILVINCVIFNVPSFAQSNAETIDELVSRYYKIGKFNGCILVAENGKITYENALGFADVEQTEKLALDHSFRLASVSKQFTAMAIMILQDRGKISYQDDVRKYIPEFPYKNITIRHLLTHTSGLPSYLPLLDQYWDTTNVKRDELKVASNIDALRLLVEHHPSIKFNPGERHEYCNTGYMLMALIVEHISGQSFQEFMKHNIFQPLGMNNTYVNERTGILPEKKRAHGIRANSEGNGFIPYDHHYQNGMFGDGGIISTIKDMFKWDQALYTEKLISKATLEEAFSPAILNDSSKINYGFGWSIIPVEEGLIVAHGGGWLGFSSFILREITRKITIIQLHNMHGAPKDDLAFTIYDILCGKDYSLPVKEPVTFYVDMRIPMQHQVFEPWNGDQISIRGSFNSWNKTMETLSDSDQDSVYTGTFDFFGKESETVEYKFVIQKEDNAVVWEDNPNPENPPYGNRQFSLTGGLQTLSTAVFNLDKYSINYKAEFTASELREDFAQFRRFVENHPALYDFTNKPTFDELFDSQLSLLNKPMSGDAFYRLTAPIVGRIGCGHSTISVPDSWWKNAPDRFFPLKLHFTNNKAYVIQNYSQAENIVPGSEVTSINGIPISELMNQLISITSADGHNIGYKIEHINRRFPYIYALMYGFPEQFQIGHILPNNTQRSAKLIPVGGAIIADSNQWRSILQLDLIKEKGTAILTLNNFNYYEDQERFFHFIDSSFFEIDNLNIKNLILDLRDNDGGNPFCTAHLLSYLTPKPMPYFAQRYGRYSKLAYPISLAEKRFKGNLFILINGKCFSSTGHFCALLKFHNIGTFVGSETGGTYTCNDAKETIQLKNSRLRLQVARGSFAVAVQGMSKERGIIPDYQVETQIQDLIIGRDSTKEFTLSLIDSLNSSLD